MCNCHNPEKETGYSEVKNPISQLNTGKRNPRIRNPGV